MERATFTYSSKKNADQADGGQHNTKQGYRDSLTGRDTNKDSAKAMPTQEEVLERSARGKVDAGAQHLDAIRQAQREIYKMMDENPRNIYPYI